MFESLKSAPNNSDTSHNTLKPEQNAWHFVDNKLKFIFLDDFFSS